MNDCIQTQYFIRISAAASLTNTFFDLPDPPLLLSLPSYCSMISTNSYVCVFAIDFSKALDSIKHCKLFDKMSSIHVLDEIFNWMENLWWAWALPEITRRNVSNCHYIRWCRTGIRHRTSSLRLTCDLGTWQRLHQLRGWYLSRHPRCQQPHQRRRAKPDRRLGSRKQSTTKYGQVQRNYFSGARCTWEVRTVAITVHVSAQNEWQSWLCLVSSSMISWRRVTTSLNFWRRVPDCCMHFACWEYEAYPSSLYKTYSVQQLKPSWYTPRLHGLVSALQEIVFDWMPSSTDPWSWDIETTTHLTLALCSLTVMIRLEICTNTVINLVYSPVHDCISPCFS